MATGPQPDGSAFGSPEGLLGRLAGLTMAFLNGAMNRAAVEILDPGPDAHVLEVGFGPGEALAELLRRTERGRVAGVDPSAAMHAQARRRNRAAIGEGRLVLRSATAEAIPFDDAEFSHVLSVNSAQIWPAPEAGFRECRRVLAPGGLLVAAVRVRSDSGRRPFDGIALDAPALGRLQGALAGAGFRDVELRVQRAGLMTAGCFRARA